MFNKVIKFAFVLPIISATTLHARECEIPMKELSVGSVTLMQNLKSFRKSHDHIEVQRDSISVLGGTDYSFSIEGVMYATSISYDALKDRIIGFSLTYTGGKYGDFDTLINVFKKNILGVSNLPKNNWVLTEKDDTQSYAYSCNDYKIFINQDNGRSGSTVAVFSRYSDFFSDDTYY